MPSPVPGQTFGRYLVDAFIARGGMGEIYRATDVTLRRPVALKVLSRQEAEADDSVTRFLREARLAAELSHPHIVVVYEAGQVADTLYLAMEWIEGLTLRATLDRAPMTLLRRIEIASSIGEALAYAHDRGVVHRDVKPGNVIVDRHGRPKLLDFGIAKRALLSSEATFQTGDGAILGTPLYMAPEQMHTANVTPAADQFAWAVVAYETISGKHPRDVAGPHFPFGLARGLPWPGAINRELASVVERAMCPDPAGRFASMHQLLAAWSSALDLGPNAPARMATRGAVESGTIQSTRRAEETKRESKQERRPVQSHPPTPARRDDAASRLFPLFIGILVVLGTSVVSIALAVRIRHAHPDRGEIAVSAPPPSTAPTATAPPSSTGEPPPVRPVVAPKRSSPPRPTSKSDSKGDAPTEVKDVAEPAGPARPAKFGIAPSHMRALDDAEIAAASAAASGVDACVTKHGGLVAGDQIYVNVYFGEQTRIVKEIVHDAQNPVPSELRSCVDAVLARIPFRAHAFKTPVSFVYDF